MNSANRSSGNMMGGSILSEFRTLLNSCQVSILNFFYNSKIGNDFNVKYYVQKKTFRKKEHYWSYNL